MKTVTTREIKTNAHNFDGRTVEITLPKGTVIDDLKEPKTGTFTALVPDYGRRLTFIGLDADSFMEVE